MEAHQKFSHLDFRRSSNAHPIKEVAVRKSPIKVNGINKRGGLNVARSQFLLDIVPSHRK